MSHAMNDSRQTENGPAMALALESWLGGLVEASAACLRTPAAEVADVRDVAPYISRMRELMAEKKGVGLAAPQCGIGLRFFLSAIEGHRVVINPRIVRTFGGRVSKPEGCLTWPGRTTFVARHEGIVAEWTDRNGAKKTTTLTGFPARIFQHETDHLNGVCIFT